MSNDIVERLLNFRPPYGWPEEVSTIIEPPMNKVAAAEILRLRAEVRLFEIVVCETAKALGVVPDNDAIIEGIESLRAENEKLRADIAIAWETFELIAKSYGPYNPQDRNLSDYVDGYVQAYDDIAKAIRNYQLMLNSSSAASNRQEILDSSKRAAAAALKETDNG